MKAVSAVIITYNEAHNLKKSLPKLHWCNEIIIVDSGSQDDTIEVCKQFGCKIFYRKFEGYGMQKRFAVKQAKNDWVICLDADEILSNELVDEIMTEMLKPKADGYLIPMNFFFMGKEFKHGKESWRFFMRLFNKNKGNFNIDKVHEKIELDGNTQKLKNLIYHHSYTSYTQYFEKFNKYSSFGAEAGFQKRKTRSVAMVICAIPLNFLKYYFLERNFLNGIKGFYWSVLNAFYHFVKYIKLREMYSNQPQAIIETMDFNSSIKLPSKLNDGSR